MMLFDAQKRHLYLLKVKIFKNKVLDLLNDEQLSINMGKRGYEIVNDEFSLDKKIDYLISCYNH
mgnify:CR=1 FL=1